MVRGHWGSQAAGILFTTGERIFLALRSREVLDPGVWGIPGGAVPLDCEGEPMHLLDSARRETAEELGGLPGPARLVARTTWTSPDGSGFRYTSFVFRVPPSAARIFEPRLNWENEDWGWFSQPDLLELDLHPAFGEALVEVYDAVFDQPVPPVRRALRRGSASKRRARLQQVEGLRQALASLSDEAVSAFEEQSRRLGRSGDERMARRQLRRRGLRRTPLDLDALFRGQS